MENVLASWTPDFVVSLFSSAIVPVVVGGVFLLGIFWIVGYVVDHLFRFMS